MRRTMLGGALLAVMACQPTGPTGDSSSLPEFSLVDVNPGSATSGQAISWRTYQGHVSGWYFTHTT